MTAQSPRPGFEWDAQSKNWIRVDAPGLTGKEKPEEWVTGSTLPRESDPLGKDAHSPGAKLDAGKPRPALVLGGFARALLAVSAVGTYGAVKYTDNGWQEVPNGISRYDDAKLRHWLYEKAGQECDVDTEELHAAHEAWNALARLDLILRKKEQDVK